MRSTKLGHSELSVSRLGLGGTVVENDADGWVRRDDFVALLEACTSELGITYLDSAESYELSEEVIGQWLASRGSSLRRKLVIGSKVLPPRLKSGPRSGTGLTREFLRKSLDGSLRRLKLDCLDLYWMHCPDPTTPLAETLHGFDEAVRAGKIRAFGISNVSSEQIEEVVSVCGREGFAPPAAVQNEFNFLCWPRQQKSLGVCRKHGLSFFGFSPLATGFLTGQYRLGQALPAGSRWASMRPGAFESRFGERWAFDAVEALSAEARRRGLTTAALALAWCLGNREVDVTLIGPRKPAHLEAVRTALETKLTSSEMAGLSALFWS